MSLRVSSHLCVYRIAISVYVHVQHARVASGLDLVASSSICSRVRAAANDCALSYQKQSCDVHGPLRPIPNDCSICIHRLPVAGANTICSHSCHRLSPPTRGLSLFDLYVALSRSSSRSMIRLLCDFTDKVFEAVRCPELLAFNDTINELNGITTQSHRMVGTQCNS